MKLLTTTNAIRLILFGFLPTVLIITIVIFHQHPNL